MAWLLIRARPLFFALFVAACSTPTTMTGACLTAADCPAGQECIAGGCAVPPMRDSGVLPDAAPSDMGTATGTDSGVEVDAFSLDDDAAMSEPDAYVPPVGDTCADPIAIVLEPTTLSAGIDGNFAGFGWQYDTFCTDAPSPDAVYRLDVPPLGAGESYDIEIRVTGDADTDTVLGMSETCADGEFYSCHDDRSPDNHDPRMILHRYPSEQLYILVRGYDGDDVGGYHLDVELRPAANTGDCATEIDLTGGAYVVGWNPPANMTMTPSCMGAGLRHADVFRVDRGGEMMVDSIDAYFGASPAAVAFIDQCSAPTVEAFCEPAVFMDGTHYGLSGSDFPFGTPAVGYLVVAEQPPAESYSFSFYP